MKSILLTSILSILLFASALSAQDADPKPTPKPKQMLGWVEKVRLYPGNLLLHAKMAIGSENSSIGVKNVKKFTRNGKKWVRFKMTDRNNKTKVLEKRLARIMKIKRTGEGSISRYTVKMGICLADRYIEDEVTLADRDDYEYEMLVGQSFLAGSFTVDPALTYTKKPKCLDIPKED